VKLLDTFLVEFLANTTELTCERCCMNPWRSSQKVRRRRDWSGKASEPSGRRTSRRSAVERSNL